MGMVSTNSKRKERVRLTTDDLLQLLAQTKHGRPNYGAILRYYRQQAGWTAERLALLYSEILRSDEKEPVTPQWIYIMERKNEVPLDEKRRWILARLLNIPPFLFGLQPIEPALTDLFRWQAIDVQEYRQTLNNYNQGWRSGSIFLAASDIKRRISNLYHKALYSSERKTLLELLCGYLILFSGLAYDCMDFEADLEHITAAIIIAEQEGFHDLLAFALREKGLMYKGRGEIKLALKGYAAAQQDFTQAALYLRQAQSLGPKIHPLLSGMINSVVGMGCVYTAQSEHDFKEAMKLVDASAKQIGQPAADLPSVPAALDWERVYLSRASIYLASPLAKPSHGKSARYELEQASNKAIHAVTRRSFGATLLARSYLVSKEYEMAVMYTEEALSFLEHHPSPINLARLNAIYQQLRTSPYANNDDVALLGAKLLKAEKPGLLQ
jgi:transcriptional regulator with XRE-family HTH domain